MRGLAIHAHILEKRATTMREAFARQPGSTPVTWRKTATDVQAAEIARHALLTGALQIAVYFTDAHGRRIKGG